jgi:hypothetical protein
MEKVTMRLDNDWHGNSSETLWVSPWFKENSFQVRNIPFYAKGVSLDDIIETDEIDGTKYFKCIFKKSGHSTYRIFLANNVTEQQFNSYWAPLEKIGCSYEKGFNRFYSIDVPSDADIYIAHSLLENGEKNNVWEFEEADIGHELR